MTDVRKAIDYWKNGSSSELVFNAIADRFGNMEVEVREYQRRIVELEFNIDTQRGINTRVCKRMEKIERSIDQLKRGTDRAADSPEQPRCVLCGSSRWQLVRVAGRWRWQDPGTGEIHKLNGQNEVCCNHDLMRAAADIPGAVPVGE